MPLCLSFFTRPMDVDVLRNHAHYCQLYGYPHKWVEASHVAHPALRDSFKYSQILHHLRAQAEGDWLFFIDDDSAVFHPVAVDALLQGRDLVVVDGPFDDGTSGHAMTNMLAMRNTPANRALVHQMIADSCRVITLERPHLDEMGRLASAGILERQAALAGVYVNINWRNVNWFEAKIFVVCLAPLPIKEADGTFRSSMLHDLNLQGMLMRHATQALIHGGPALRPAAYPALSDEPMSRYGGRGDIAFVTFYSHHVAAYGRVAEHNAKRYCERHGHSYYVYRQLPDELQATGMTGSWAKPWLLLRHLADHEWVVWVDADVLFVNQSRRIEPFLQDRDLLLAKDIGGWAVNSGVMGFRRTARNVQLLENICQRIERVEDKSGVYTSQGDQYYVNLALSEMGLTGEAQVLDNVSINTPPHLATHESLLVHFIGLGEPYRSAYMADWDGRSKALG